MDRKEDFSQSNEQRKENPYLKILQENREGFGRRAQEIMNEKGTDVLEIARQLKFKAKELGYILLGWQPVTEEVLQGLCEILNIDPIEFLPDEAVNSLLVEKVVEKLNPSAVLDRINKQRKEFDGKGAILIIPPNPSRPHREFRLRWVRSRPDRSFGRSISIIFSPSLKANEPLRKSLGLSHERFAGVVISGGLSLNLQLPDWERHVNGGILKLEEPIEELIPAFKEAITRALKNSYWERLDL